MLALFETAVGFALFKVLDEGKLTQVEDVWKEFSSAGSARQVVKLKAFSKFENKTEALEVATRLIDGKPSKGLRKFLRAHCHGETLAVADCKLGKVIKENLKIDCVHNTAVMELMRGVRNQLTELLSGLQVQDLAQMSLGLSHGLSRYKLKFSVDKVDTLVIDAIGYLDGLDKDLNTFAMAVQEWYGWHFPELAKIVQGSILYAKTVKMMGNRANAAKVDFSEILPEEVETELKEAAMISMGTEVSEQDIIIIKQLCDDVFNLSDYRAQLYDFIKNRMNIIAPSFTAVVGELVGARLMAHAGSLLNLAKLPGSTVQVLGAEKALFRALKTKHPTPKYGIIYRASVIGQAPPKLKGKISRSLSAKAVLALRYDTLGDKQDNSMGLEYAAKLEARLRNLKSREVGRFAGSAKGKPKIEVYDKDRKKGYGGLITAAKAYNSAADSVLGKTTPFAGNRGDKNKSEVQPPKTEETADGVPVTGEDKKGKMKKKRKKADDEGMPVPNGGNGNVEPESEEPVKKEKKKRKKHSAEDVAVLDGVENVDAGDKKRKRKHAAEEESEMRSKKKEKKKKSED